MKAKTSLDSDSNPKGFLIDLDYAQRHTTHPTCCATGTAPFMALELLLNNNVCHTWRHDLESFLYVIIWLCTKNPYTTLKDWVKGMESIGFASIKFTHITSTYFNRFVLGGFLPRFEPLKELVSRFKDILFRNSTTTPDGDSEKNDIYNEVIQVFNDCIAKLQQESWGHGYGDGGDEREDVGENVEDGVGGNRGDIEERP